MNETLSLINKLEPIIGSGLANGYREDLNAGKFSAILRKDVEFSVRGLANELDIENQNVIYPVPKRYEVGGEYSLGKCQYGVFPMNAEFGLRSHDMIKHVGLFGATGAGKTTTAKQIVKQLCEKGNPFLIIDPKGTWEHVIKYPWAKNVKILRLGSSHAPYTLDPFKPLEGQDIEVLKADIVEALCDSQYLGFGAKALLKRACDSAKDLSLRGVYKAFRELDIKGMKKSQWAESTERALETASSGILGRVLNSPDNIPFEKLMDSHVILVMDLLTDDDQIAMFNALLLNRIYWFRKLDGVKELFKHLLIFEEFHVMSNAEKFKGESRIDYMVKMCREYSQGIMVMDQNPGKISDAVLGNLNTVISMNLGHSKDINAIGTAMAMDPEHKRYLGRLSVGEAICKVKDRLKDPVLVKIDHPEDVRKPDNPTDVEVVAHNGDFVSQIPQKTDGFKPEIVKDVAIKQEEIKLEPLDRKILRYVKINDGPNLRTVYLAHGLSYRRGNTIRKKLEEGGYLISENVNTETGKAIRVWLTEKSHKFLENKEDSRRFGGPWHRGAVDQIAKLMESRGCVALREYQGVDLMIDKGSEKVAYEMETLKATKDVVHAVQNAHKASKVADRVVMIVRDRAAKRKLREALNQSIMRNYRNLKIRLLAEYQ